ncbi:hypothetical protein C8J57DRAFT_1247856 [Mycena rebaudengoi]|nr:hypothetical protein C8J57DRAFT_1247856 [Mycena rebaudengoi]
MSGPALPPSTSALPPSTSAATDAKKIKARKREHSGGFTDEFDTFWKSLSETQKQEWKGAETRAKSAMQQTHIVRGRWRGADKYHVRGRVSGQAGGRRCPQMGHMKTATFEACVMSKRKPLAVRVGGILYGPLEYMLLGQAVLDELSASPPAKEVHQEKAKYSRVEVVTLVVSHCL